MKNSFYIYQTLIRTLFYSFEKTKIRILCFTKSRIHPRLFMLLLFVGMGVVAQGQLIQWNFDGGSGTANASTTSTNLTASALSQGNNNGTTILITNASTSSGYTGASGNYNAGAAARTGSLVTGSSGSAYFEFTITPAAGYNFSLTGISFGTRSTNTGPQAYTIRYSTDSYGSDLATGSISGTNWNLKTNSSLTITSGVATPVTFRIYGYNGTGSPVANTANWRIDDLSLTISAVLATPTITPTPTTLTGLDYVYGSGPSTSQSFTLSASNLTAGGGTITISGTSNYDVSTTSSTTGFGSSASLTYTGTGTLAANTVWVRLKSGLAISNYNSESIGISGGGATSSVTVSGTVSRKTITSNADGDWNTGSTWVGGVAPTADDNVVINHAVTSTAAITRNSGTTTTVNSGKSLAMGATYTNNGTTTINGTFQLNEGAWATGTGLVYGAGTGTLVFNKTSAGAYGVGGDAYWPSSNGPVNVTVMGNGITMNVSRTVTGTVTLSGASSITGSNVLTSSGTFLLAATLDVQNAGGLVINGTLQINSGNLSSNSPVYGSSSTLIYNATYNIYLEWTGNNSTAGTGVPQNVTIQSGKTLTMTTSHRGLAGNLTINGTLILNGASGDLYVGGNWERAATGTFTHNNRAVFFNGNKTQTINATSLQSGTFAYLFVGSGSGTTTVQLGADINVGTNSQISNVLSFSTSNDVIDLNGKKILIGTNGVASTISGSGSFKGNAASDMELRGSGLIGTIKFTSNLNLATLTLNRTASGGFTLGSALTINTSLVFTSGVLTLGSNDITFAAAATVGGSPGNLSMIDASSTGKVKKMYSATGSFTFPIGNIVSDRIYTPATFNFTSGTFGGSASVSVNVQPVVQTFTTPNASASYIKRYWNVSTSNITSYSCTASFTYNIPGSYYPTDLVGTEANVKIAGWNASESGWVVGGTTNTTTHTLSLTTSSLQDAYTGGDAFDPIVSNYSDYFRTRTVTGDYKWSTPSNWESSTDNSTWHTATKAPQNGAAAITIKDSLVLDVNKDLDGLTINTGGVLNHLVSQTLGIKTGGVFTVNGTYIVNGKIPTFTGTATMIINSGGIVRANDNTGGESDDIAQSTSTKVTFKTGSIFEWNTNAFTFATSGLSYFPNGAEIPIFRISKTISPGAGTATTFNGILDVNANVTFSGGSAKTFRNGITGNATLTQNTTSGNSFNLGSGAILGGTDLKIVLNSPLNLSTTTSVPVGGHVTISGGNINNGGTLTIDGTLDVTDVSFTPSTSVIINGTLKTKNLNGIKGTGSTFLSSSFTINDGSTIDFYAPAPGSQVIETSVNYYNITFRGGTKTFSSTNPINVNTTAGTVSILGTGVYIDASANNIASTGGNSTNFVMEGGTLILGMTGAQPNMDGTYNITGGLIRFNRTSGQTIRPKTYNNIEIASGATVGSSSGYISLNANAIFTVKSGAIFNNTNYSIKADGVTTGQQIIVENGGKITSDRNGGFYGSDGTGSVFSAIHSNIAAANILLDPGSTVELNASGDQTTKLGGVTYGNLILSGSGNKYFEGTVNVKGDLTNNAGCTLRTDGTTTGSFVFNSTAADQTIDGGGSYYLNSLTMNKSGKTLYLKNSINQIDDLLSLMNGTLDLTSGISITFSDGVDLSIGTGDFSSSSTDASLIFKGNANVGNPGGSTANLYPKIYLTPTSTGGVNFAGNPTVQNLIQLNAGSYINTNAPKYSSSSLLQYNNGGSYDRSVEWSQTSGGGYPYNVQISNNTILNPAKGDASFQNTAFNIAGNLTIDNGSSIRMDYGVGAVTGMLQPLVVGGNLQIDGDLYASLQAGGDIKVNGNWTRGSNGKFYPNDRAVFFIGSGNSTLTVNADEHRDSFPYLILDKNAVGNQLSLVDSVVVSKKFTFTKGTLQLVNSDVTFRSDTTNTASLTALDKNNTAIDYSGTGRFIVERYLPSHRAWHFFSVPTKGSTFKSAWQEDNDPGSGMDPTKNKKPGYGTILTSPYGTSAGFDTISPQPSVKYFNNDSAKYYSLPKTDTLMDSGGGYMVFIRGDRSVNPNYGVPNSTTLRTRGIIYSPGAPADTIKIKKDTFALVGNPYPSAIDFSKFDTTYLSGAYYVWDPNLTGNYGLGAFQTFSGGEVTPGGGSYGGAGPFYIQSGQSFFVQAQSDTLGTIYIPETAKVDGSVIGVFRTNMQPDVLAPPSAQLKVSFYRILSGSPILVDGVISLFNDEYSNDYDKWDASKLYNLNSENMGLISNGKVLSIERKQLPLENDTIFYKMNNYKIAPYRFRFITNKLDISGQDAFLYDKYLTLLTPIPPNDTTFYDFVITGATGSWDENRFSIVFKNSKTTPVTLTNLKAYTKNKDIVVEWSVENESNMRSYTIETSTDGKTFIKGGTVAAKNVLATTYQWLDVNVNPGYHYYRILSTEIDGKTNYSKIVRVLVGHNSGNGKITIYPNPIKDGVINLQFENQEAGVYQLRLLNSVGQVMINKTINHPGGSSSELLILNSTITKGVYHLEIYKGSERVMSEKVVY